MNYFDFHCHLDDQKFDQSGDKPREQLLKDMQEQGISALTIGVDFDSSRRAVALATANNHMWASIGQHPLDNPTELFQTDRYQDLIETHERIVCVGECGLDYYWPQKDLDAGKITADDLVTEKNRQKLLFIKNILLAIENDLPLMLHVRSSEKDGVSTQDAHEETLVVLSEYPQIKAVFHFYTENTELAQRIIEAGYYISLPGVVTYPSATHLEEVIKFVPLDRLFAETDSPYAAPVPYRGKTNTPIMVEEVYKKIAEEKEIKVEEVRDQIFENIERLCEIKV